MCVCVCVGGGGGIPKMELAKVDERGPLDNLDPSQGVPHNLLDSSSFLCISH